MIKIYTPIYDDGKLAFHMTFDWPVYDKKRMYSKIGATLPTELLWYAMPTLVQMRKQLVKPSNEEVVSLLKDIGSKIVDSNQVQSYFYPSFLLENNMMSEKKVETILRQLNGIFPLPGTHFSPSCNESAFYVLTTKLFIQKKTMELAPQPIHKFESLLNSHKMKKEYVEMWSKENKVVSFVDGVEYLMLSNDLGLPLMIIAK